MIRKNIHLSEKQILRLERLSEDSGIKKAELVRRAVDDFINKSFDLIRIRNEGTTGITGISG